MRLEQLYHIAEVAKCKSISLASEHTYISQPAISSSISKLELELGVTLFKRTNQGMLPTEIGEIIIQKSIDIIDQIEEIKDIARTNSMELTGDVSIAVEPSFCNTIMVNIITTFKYKYPKVNLMLKVGESNDILHDVLSGKADIGIALKTKELIESNNFITKVLLKDRLMMIAGKKSVIATKKDISIKEALEQPLALYNTGYETSCAISQVINKYGDLNVAYRFDNLNIIEEIVSSGNCIAFVPQLMTGYYHQSDTIITLPIKDANLEIDAVMLWNKRHRVSTVEKELIKTIKSLCSVCEFI